jgi:hypothetical protein
MDRRNVQKVRFRRKHPAFMNVKKCVGGGDNSLHLSELHEYLIPERRSILPETSCFPPGNVTVSNALHILYPVISPTAEDAFPHSKTAGLSGINTVFRVTETFLNAPETFDRSTETSCRAIEAFRRATETFFGTTEICRGATATFFSTTEVFRCTTDTFFCTTKDFFSTTGDFQRSTATFFSATEDFRCTTDAFLSTTKPFLSTTENFCRAKETFRRATESLEMQNKQPETASPVSRQGQHAGRNRPASRCTVPAGRNVPPKTHIPSLTGRVQGVRHLFSTNMLFLTGHRRCGYRLFILHSFMPVIKRGFIPAESTLPASINLKNREI